ncbi:hypothetical protein K3495_g6763 [Podosphaera aphanis]|nr:hypothetical protein K3495_g6763 [Podosphaera aphanis]
MRVVDVFVFAALASTGHAHQAPVLKDISKISRYWGHLTPYRDHPDGRFGVEYAGLPDGCQIENVQTLQRHADRFSTSWIGDGDKNRNFGRKVSGYRSTKSNNSSFTGPLEFLNSWDTIDSTTGLLTGIGATSMFTAGVQFWNRYGRTLFNATAAQLAYDPNFPNGTARPPIVLRTTEQSRMHNSQINWALGFFGSTAQKVPNPLFVNISKPFEVVLISEELKGQTQNNTLASYVSCPNLYKQNIGAIGETFVPKYIPIYLASALERLRIFAPADFSLTIDDIYTMQSLCAYENAYIGDSDFCHFFTEDEWAGYENSLDIAYYYDSAFGNPTGRAQGIGYVQELLARLNHSLITTSSSSINSTLNNNTATFPIDQTFYADFSHDNILIAALTALSIDYFHDPPSFTQFPPNPDRKFILSQITPFGARLITETIGCSSPNPVPRKTPRVHYSPTQYGYNASDASYKFIRMRLNNAILPLSTIRGGACGNDETGRIDGMCALEDFIRSQENTTALANYQHVCFADYSIENPPSGKDWDGTIF